MLEICGVPGQFLARVFCYIYNHGQDPDAILDPNETIAIPKQEAAQSAIKAFEAVFAAGPQIELDHHLVYHARKSRSV